MSKTPKPSLKLSEETKDKIITARVALYGEHPFFATLAQYLGYPIPVTHIPTAAVNGRAKFYLNPEFGEKCSVQDMLFVVTHETMHLVTATMSRMPEGADPKLWNIASDLAINYLIINPEHGAGIAPPRAEVCKPLYEGFEKYWGDTTEEIYYKLLRDTKPCPVCRPSSNTPNKGKGSNSKSKDPDNKEHSKGCPFKGFWWDTSGSECGHEGGMTEEEISEWKQKIAAAAAEARQAGKLPGSLGNFVTDLLQPKKNWKRELRMATNKALRKRYDWKRVARRTAGTVRTPGKSPHLPSALIYMDTSGSMSDDDIRDAINEIAEIVRLGGGKAKLILGDAEVYYCGEVSVNQLKNLPVQRGGTNFIPVFEMIAEENLNPSIFIGFSDLEGSFPHLSPNYPVIWCRPQGYKTDAPFGRVIDIEL